MSDTKPRPKRKKIRREKVGAHFLPVVDRELNFDEVNLGYYSTEEIASEADRCLSCKKPRCVAACPTSFEVPKMLAALKEGNFQAGADVVNDFFCTPSSQNRVCPAFCQEACIVGIRGDPVQILNIKRYLSDNYEKPVSFYERAPLTHKKVAVIGSGPAGLTAAHDLARMGHDVTVFEMNMLGGMLAVGIPEYRLKNSMLHAEIAELEKLGIEFDLGKKYGKDFNHEDLFVSGYDVVILAIGAHKPKFMRVEGADLKGSVHAIEFLRDFAMGKDVSNLASPEKKVMVIGGGDVAIDAVRVASRLGAQANIVYRRTLAEMPATQEEIHATQEEEIPIEFLTNPLEIISDIEEEKIGIFGKLMGKKAKPVEKKVTHVKLVKMELGEPDESGRRRPVEIEDSEYIISVDTVIHAISQEPDVEDIKKDGFELSKWNTFEVDENTFMTNIDGVFALGDTVSGPKTAVEAISHAKIAVKEIDLFLTGKSIAKDITPAM